MTGHTGFKGSWMSLWLQHLGAKLTGYALKPPTKPSLFLEARVDEGMRSIISDIRDSEALLSAMRTVQPEIVFHFAAQPLVRYSYQNPVETFATNVMGTVHLLEAIRQTDTVRAIVNITSDKCYENREWIWGYRENEAMGGYDPYSSSKGCAELVSSAYRSSFFNADTYAKHGVALATARAGNVIGGGDWAKDRLVPDILAAFEQNKTVHIRNLHAIRPWQHVLEPLRGYLMLAERLVVNGPEFAGSWNFGPDDENTQSVGWIVEQMAERWGTGSQWRKDTAEHQHEASYLKLDISKVRSQLNWHPTLRLADTLDLTIDWAKQRQAGVDVRALTLSQIRSYQAMFQH